MRANGSNWPCPDGLKSVAVVIGVAFLCLLSAAYPKDERKDRGSTGGSKIIFDGAEGLAEIAPRDRPVSLA